MDPEVKRLYDEANTLHTQAKTILDEFKGKDMPAEKSKQVDDLLDLVEAKTHEAKRLERADGMEQFFNQPKSQLPMNQGGEGKGGSLSAETKTALKRAGFKPGEIDEYFYEEAQAKQALAVMQYWKSGLDGVERKDLATAPAGAGGYLVTETQRSELLTKQAPVSAMRRISRVLPRSQAARPSPRPRRTT